MVLCDKEDINCSVCQGYQVQPPQSLCGLLCPVAPAPVLTWESWHTLLHLTVFKNIMLIIISNAWKICFRFQLEILLLSDSVCGWTSMRDWREYQLSNLLRLQCLQSILPVHDSVSENVLRIQLVSTNTRGKKWHSLKSISGPTVVPVQP